MKTNRNIRDLSGQRFGRLVAIGIDDTRQSRKTYWLCKCDCGSIKSVRGDILVDGRTVSCGCKKREQDKINLVKNHYGFPATGTRLYQTWQGMKARCYNDHDARYCDYGGRGIKVCDEWKNDFEAFYKWSMQSGYKDDLTIDRINNDGNYEPDNCRWASAKTQSRNRRSNINITIGNATKTLAEWCNIFELNYPTINARYKRNGYISLDDLFSGGKYRGKQ